MVFPIAVCGQGPAPAPPGPHCSQTPGVSCGFLVKTHLCLSLLKLLLVTDGLKELEAIRPAQWHNSLILCLQHQLPMRVPVGAPAAPLLSQFPLNGLGNQWNMGFHESLNPHTRPRRVSWSGQLNSALVAIWEVKTQIVNKNKYIF